MKYIKCISLILILFLLAIGCSGDYGIVRRQPPTDNKMTIAELRENWEDYHVYYGNSGGSIPVNIMFDPKNNETRLAIDGGWHKIADQQTLSEIMERIEIVWTNQEVMIVEGPDRRFFGYMYCSWATGGNWSFTPSRYVVKRVDEHTLYVGGGL